ncbi:MAG: DUF3037 domain-containing protein [Gammaproteobacteria bacterium]|nr:DUF3037 domain-containing protein [Gammaproteobacteria bacterium]
MVQFLPYAETEEFANVGVLVICRKNGFLALRLKMV